MNQNKVQYNIWKNPDVIDQSNWNVMKNVMQCNVMK